MNVRACEVAVFNRSHMTIFERHQFGNIFYKILYYYAIIKLRCHIDAVAVKPGGWKGEGLDPPSPLFFSMN